MTTAEAPLEKIPTGIPGFDLIAEGGLPRGRSTLVSGSAGSCKTVFACQFLAAGIRQYGEGGVFITFEEAPEDVRSNVQSFGWDIAGWEAAGMWAFVDASPQSEAGLVESGAYDLDALMARVEHAVRKTSARRVSIDSLAGVFGQLSNQALIRHELHRLVRAFRSWGVTAVVTGERLDEAGTVARFGVEEFVTDNLVLLYNSRELDHRRRTLELLKVRGTTHQKGAYPFTVTSQSGIVVLPFSANELKQRSSYVRITSGNADLDAMCGGGFFRDSVILVSGPTGTGKTLITTHFIAAGSRQGERSLLLAFEESRDQLIRNASGWGIGIEELERAGLLRVVAVYPESSTLEDHLLRLKTEIEEFAPQRVAVDSLTALERVASVRAFREFVIGLTSFVKEKEVASVFTATTEALLGGSSITEAHISTITDTILLLRYVEIFGRMHRGLAVLKMRGSAHDKDIRELTIDDNGMHIGGPFRSVSGILAGNFTFHHAAAPARVEDLFKEEAGGDDRADGG